MHTPPPLKQKPISGGGESRAEGTRPRSAASFGVAPPLFVRPPHARSCPHQAAHPLGSVGTGPALSGERLAPPL